jgi:hypothetical protein
MAQAFNLNVVGINKKPLPAAEDRVFNANLVSQVVTETVADVPTGVATVTMLDSYGGGTNQTFQVTDTTAEVLVLLNAVATAT